MKDSNDCKNSTVCHRFKSTKFFLMRDLNRKETRFVDDRKSLRSIGLFRDKNQLKKSFTRSYKLK